MIRKINLNWGLKIIDSLRRHQTCGSMRISSTQFRGSTLSRSRTRLWWLLQSMKKMWYRPSAILCQMSHVNTLSISRSMSKKRRTMKRHALSIRSEWRHEIALTVNSSTISSSRNTSNRRGLCQTQRSKVKRFVMLQHSRVIRHSSCKWKPKEVICPSTGLDREQDQIRGLKNLTWSWFKFQIDRATLWYTSHISWVS